MSSSFWCEQQPNKHKNSKGNKGFNSMGNHFQSIHLITNNSPKNASKKFTRFINCSSLKDDIVCNGE